MNPRILYVAFVLSIVIYVNHTEQSQQLPMVKADYPVCVTIKPGTLEPKKSGVNRYPRQRDVA